MDNLPLLDFYGLDDYKKPNYKEIEQAREKIKKVFTSREKELIMVSFSAGKDSSLLGQLTLEVAEEINALDRVRFIMSDTRHNEEEAQDWHNNFIIPAFTKSKTPLLIAQPSLFYNYFVQTLGRGVDCLSYTPKQTRCLGRWKLDVLNKVKTEYKGFYLTGRRKDESKRRAKLLETPKESDVLSDVSTATLWAYLEEVKDLKFGLAFDDLKNYYKNKKRDGCWCCPYGSSPSNKGLKRIVDFQEVWRESRPYNFTTPIEFWAPFKKRYADKINPTNGNKGKCGFCSLEHRKKLFHLLERVIERYNVPWILPEICKKMIFEFWNIAESYSGELGALCLTREAFRYYRDQRGYKIKYPEILHDVFLDFDKVKIIKMVEAFKNF